MTGSQERNPVELLADEFVERFRRGERPALTEYTDGNPELADEIRELFPLLVEMEDVRSLDDAAASRSDATLQASDLRQLGDYRIIREIGRGGMGIVYEAEQISLGRRVALKVLPKELLESPKQRSRFEREAKAAARLHHTNIVPVFGVGEHDGQGYYVMQFIQGLALDEVLNELKQLKIKPGSSSASSATGEIRVSRREASALDVAKSLMNGELPQLAGETEDGSDKMLAVDRTVVLPSAASPPSPVADQSPVTGRLSDTFALSGSTVALPGGSSGSTHKSAKKRTYWESVAVIGAQVAEALEYAHGQGILHRDIKPANLLLDMQGTVWVTDFGLAKLDDERNLTQTGDILGTLRYMAPEAFKGQTDARSEIYSLGLSLYELLALRPAFDETNKSTLVEQVMSAKVEPLGKLNPEIPVDLQTIVHKAIERDPPHRYSSAAELAEDLQRFLDDEPIKARRISLPERFSRWARRNKTLAASLSAITLLITALAIGSTLAARYFQNLSRNLADSESQAQTERDQAQRLSYAATIQLAESMLNGDDASSYRVADLLWSTPPDLRGWEWGHLMARCHLEQWSLPTHVSGLAALATSPDGRLLVTASGDGTVILWDVSKRAEVWRRQTKQPVKLAVDSRNRFVAVAFSEESASCFTILDVASGRVVHEAGQGGIADVAFSADGKDFYAAIRGGGDPTIRRFSTETWEQLAEAQWPDKPFERNANLFVDAAGTYVGIFRRYDGTGECHLKFAFLDARTLAAVADLENLNESSDNTQSMATPVLDSAQGHVIHADVNTVVTRSLNAEPTLLASLPGRIYHLVVNSASGVVVAATRDGLVRVINTDGEKRDILHGSSINGLALLPDGRLLTGGADGLVKCWRLPGPTKLFDSAAPADIPSPSGVFVDFSNDNQRLMFANHQRTGRYIVDMTSLSARPRAWSETAVWRFQTLFRPGTNEFLVADPTGLWFHQLEGNDLVRPDRTFKIANPRYAAVDRSGRLLVVTTREEETHVFDIATGRQLPTPEVSGYGPSAVDPAAKRAAILSSEELQVWDIASGRIHNRWQIPSAILKVNAARRSLDYHPQEQVIALIADRYVTDFFTGLNSTVYLWDAERGEMLPPIKVNPGSIPHRCRFSRDGNRLFIGDYHGSLEIWDWRAGKYLISLPASQGRANSIAQSPDGLTLAYTGWAPSLQISKALPWHLPRDQQFYQAVDELRAFTERLGQ